MAKGLTFKHSFVSLYHIAGMFENVELYFCFNGLKRLIYFDILYSDLDGNRLTVLKHEIDSTRSNERRQVYYDSRMDDKPVGIRS